MLLLNPFLRRSASRFATSGRARTGNRSRLTIESLEIRSLLSATWPGLVDPQSEAEPNNTLDVAQDVGRVDAGASAEFVGRVGDGNQPTTDVDWFSFTLASAGRVQLMSLSAANGTTSPIVLTLYGDQLAEFDPTVPLQHRLLGRQEALATTDVARIDRQLAAGTYFVAVSGAGNRFFHPFVTDSGVPGQATDYGVRIAITSGPTPTGSFDQFAPLRESGTDGNDTTQTASDLGDLTTIQRLQVSGLIGDDHFYDVASADPFAMNPAADVDLYHFTVSGDGTFALIAESFAGRIGSPLDPALTLFRPDDAGTLQLVATNSNSLNPTQSTSGQFAFASDAVLFSGLSSGEYFLAVSGSGNDAEFGPDGVFNPQLAHSGLNGWSVGDYVLDLSVYADNVAPQIVGQVFNLPGSGEVELTAEQVENLLQAPTHLSLKFSEAVNVQQLAYTAYLQAAQNTVRAVFIEGTDGTHYFPRLQSYDEVTETAHFLMLDDLPNGDFELHVSGTLGLTDLAGNPLVTNDASGDYVTRFTVADASRVGDPTQRLNAPGNDSFETAQDLGVLFPYELQSGVTLVRDAATNASQPADSADFFHFELLQTKAYFFTLSNFGDGRPPALQVLNEAGQVMPLLSLPGGQGLLGTLPEGRYVLHFGPWDAADAGNVTYQLKMVLGGLSENPTPLANGAAPAAGIRLAGYGPAAVYVAPVITIVSQSPSTPVAAIPSGLLQGLNAPALGGQNNSLPVFAAPVISPNTAVVRLFGFSHRDRLFTLIDSTLPRVAESREAPEITKAELTDAELRELLKLKREVSDETSEKTETAPLNESRSTENLIDEQATPETPTATDTIATDTKAADSIKAAPNAKTSAELSPDSQTPTAAGRATRPAQVEIQTSTEQQPAAFGAPLALALATSLARTLRERERREDDRKISNKKASEVASACSPRLRF